MIILDIKKPNSCNECYLSCCFPVNPREKPTAGTSALYETLCRKDMKEHTPFDETCPIKGEILSKEDLKNE